MESESSSLQDFGYEENNSQNIKQNEDIKDMNYSAEISDREENDISSGKESNIKKLSSQEFNHAKHQKNKPANQTFKGQTANKQSQDDDNNDESTAQNIKNTYNPSDYENLHVSQ
ncbi:hypothetical protein SteCoe_37762 [Stentor coeruleus]|uniref:Uncharacterized protein n=1 Tax=Stentor coeruleus TaxID=5963 RepID=A0A1R2AMT2_9CILI|nr:hypothetical protein SteCoe_37762 [Stentor coeruleus]